MKYALWLVLPLLLASCGAPLAARTAPNRTTNTHSSDFATEAERVAFLGQYVILKSALNETEFHIIYHDNSDGLVPGPSDWDIRAVMHVTDVAAWTADKTPTEAFDITWADDLYSDSLRPASQPDFYQNATVQMAVFAPEKIIVLYATTFSQ